MPHLPVKGFDDVSVVRLDRALAQRLSEDEVQTAWLGDGTCGDDNLRRSCFATEYCRLSGSATRTGVLEDLLETPVRHSFVAVRAPHPPALEFVGCVTASPVSHGMLHSLFGPVCQSVPANALLLSSLCVPAQYRHGGVGRALVDRVAALGRPVYLYVLHFHKQADDTGDEYQRRVARLLRTYAKLGFSEVARGHDRFLFGLTSPP